MQQQPMPFKMVEIKYKKMIIRVSNIPILLYKCLVFTYGKKLLTAQK